MDKVFTPTSKANKNFLQCFTWSESTRNWQTFNVTRQRWEEKFIAAVKVPNFGIWFFGGKDSLLLNENGEWKSGPKWTHARTRACSVVISDTKVAHLGGKKVADRADVGDTIDVYDFSNPTSPVESLNVAQMGWNRKHLSCALIPKGQNNHPTVAICK